MKKINKKIIGFGYLALLALGLTVPLDVSRAAEGDPTEINRLVISAVNTDNQPIGAVVEPGENIKIVAKVHTTGGGEVISFSTNTILSSFTPGKTCTIPIVPLRTYSAIETCSVMFKTEARGNTIKIEAHMPSREGAPLYPLPYLSNIVFEVDCKEPKIFSGGECKDPTGPTESDCIAKNQVLDNLTKECRPPTEAECKAENKKLNKETKQCYVDTDTTYEPLAPLPGFEEGKRFDTAQPCAFGEYMNIVFRLVIGISAVLAMVMIVYGGIEYMTGGAISEKENGKDTITNAILGLMIALGAWLLLNTLNPQLLNMCLDLPEAKITIIENFEISGGLGGEFGTWKPIKVNFNAEAYPAAKSAQAKTGVDKAFILAIFDQETRSGSNVGRCYWKQAGVMMEKSPPPARNRRDQTAFASIMKDLNQNPDTTPVSCPAPSGGWGGAMGHMQFLPTTWNSYKAKGLAYLGNNPNPWKHEDAIMMAAIYLEALNGRTDMKNAACKYYSGRACDNNPENPNMFYGNEVMQRKASIEKQIIEAIASGEIKP